MNESNKYKLKWGICINRLKNTHALGICIAMKHDTNETYLDIVLFTIDIVIGRIRDYK